VSRALAKTIFFAAALPVILRACARVAWHTRRLRLDELAPRLRRVPTLRWHRLRDPYWLLATLDRLVRVLPPWRYGLCMRRSLLLLDLWARCGLRPVLHLGLRRGDEGVHEGHAWVTVAGATGEPALATADHGYPEAFQF
jgi:hypothetical protein